MALTGPAKIFKRPQYQPSPSLDQPPHYAVVRGSELLRQFEVAVMRHRRIPDNQANLRGRVHGPVLVRYVDLERVHGIFGQPVIPIEVTDGPYHLLEPIHS